MADVRSFYRKGNKLYTWVKQYMYKRTREGPSAAQRFLIRVVPRQLHKQVVEMAERAIEKKEQPNA